ncbi:MAG: DUF11 domain-containing protein [Patescibacteria group bacterium]|nr:DUF11 domain-containing protein [Patescibacteria group bacterium]
MKKKLFSVAILILFFGILVLPRRLNASYGQYGQPGPAYAIIVDKTVGWPGTSDDPRSYKYVDNLTVSDPRFKPDQVVFFRIKIKNVSSTRLVGMEVRDTLPPFLEPLTFPGSYNQKTREIVWNAGDFNVNEEKIFYLKTKIVPQLSLPVDKGVLCVTNFVKATSANAYDDDTSHLCLEKLVTAPVTKIPDAGPAMTIGILLSSILTGTFGYYLRKKIIDNC